MSAPMFRTAVAEEAYVEPDYALIENEQDLVDEGLWPVADSHGYRPALVDDDELARIKERMRDNEIDITPDALRHAIEAEEIRKMLRRSGIKSLRKVSETRNGHGAVKLTFHEIRTLLERALAEDPKAFEGEPVT